MANNVTNILELKGSKENIDFFKSEFGEKNNNIDFNTIIPMPEELNIESTLHTDFIVGEFKSPIDNSLQRIRNWYKGIKEEDKPKIEKEFYQGILNYLKYGHQTWYTWRLENWGTKWNAYNVLFKNNKIKFDTAWNPVPSVVSAMAKQHPNVKIRYIYADEDTGYNVGLYNFENGSVISKKVLSEGSKEAYDLAFYIHPEKRNFYNLVNGNYEYKE